MKSLKRLEGSLYFWLVLFISVLFFILRFPSLFEPLWYGDEGIYQAIGTALNNGKALYSEVFDNKPPLLYWLYAFGGSDQFTIRLISMVFGLLSVIGFYFLSKVLLANNKNAPIVSTVLYAVLFGLPAFEGNIANAENFMLLPIILSAFLIVKQKKLFLAGFLLGIAFLFKIVAIFDFLAFIVFSIILNKNSLKKEIKLSSVFFGFILPILFTAIFFLSNGSFSEFLRATFTNNISYVNYGNRIGNLPILLFIKLILLGGFLFLANKNSRKLSHGALFTFIWFSFSLFNAFFSQRPYTHYLLVLIPSFSLLVGLLFSEKKYKALIGTILIVSLLLITRTFGVPNINKIINYYSNFISYAYGSKSLRSYQSFFDRNTPIDYEIARFIRPKISKTDSIFVWGNNAQLYKLVNVTAPTKYVVAYHITNYKDGLSTTKLGLSSAKPKFIVVMANSGPVPFPLAGYERRVKINDNLIYEKTF